MRAGGAEGNSILTSAAAAALIALLLVEGVTILALDQLLDVHMYVGVALIPPVLLKLLSTGYRFARYYLRTAAYREKGPPHILLRSLAPVLVAATIAVLASGVVLLLAGHRSDTALQVHKVSFIVWAVVFGVHFLAHLPRVARSLWHDWGAAGRRAVAGSGPRAAAVGVALAAGAALALAADGDVRHWHGRDRGSEEGRAHAGRLH
jgi:hypothetical protein